MKKFLLFLPVLALLTAACNKGAPASVQTNKSDNTAFSTYQNDQHIYTVQYPSSWVVHSNVLTNADSTELNSVGFSEVLTEQDSTGRAYTAPIILSLYSQTSETINTEKDWLATLGLGAKDLTQAGVEKVGNQAFLHFIAHFSPVGGATDQDFYLLKRKLYPPAGVKDPYNSFFGFHIFSGAAPEQKQAALNIVKSFKTTNIYSPQH